MDNENRLAIKVLLKFRTEITAYLWSLLRDNHIAEDIFQEVSMVAVKKAPNVEDEQHIFRWILRAARYEALAHLRRKGNERLVFSEELLDLVDESWVDLEPSSVNVVSTAMDECLEKLGDKSRELVGLRYEEGLTGAALAERCGCKVNSAYVALSRIHRVLGDCIRMAINRMEGCADG